MRSLPVLFGLVLVVVCMGSSSRAENSYGFPVPSEPNQIFYLQRSMNSNTIVYVARMVGNRLARRNPIDIFWRRFNDAGETAPLTFAERNLAFGVNAEAIGSQGDFRVTLKSYGKRSAVLKVVDGVPRLEADVAGRTARLVSAYLYLDESTTIPSVTKVDVWGETLDTKERILETFIPE